jgi:hypothetical protein
MEYPLVLGYFLRLDFMTIFDMAAAGPAKLLIYLSKNKIGKKC